SARNVERFVHHVAIGVFAATDGELVVANAHFHVVGLAGKDCQRAVLCFPSEAADSSIIRNDIWMARDSQIAFLVAMCIHVGANCGILNAFDQTEAKELQGNAKCDVAFTNGFVEVWLLKRAARSVRTSLQRE